MIIFFSQTLIEEIVQNETMVYAQIPFIQRVYFDFDSDAEHLLSLEVDKSKMIDSQSFYEGYYPYFRHRDLEKFKNLLQTVDDTTNIS